MKTLGLLKLVKTAVTKVKREYRHQMYWNFYHHLENFKAFGLALLVVVSFLIVGYFECN